MDFFRSHSIPFAFAVIGLVACSSSSSSGTPPLAQVGISSAAGGLIEVNTGPLAGLSLLVAPGSLLSDTVISVHPGVETESAGLLVISSAARFSPGGTLFNPSALLTLAFDPTLIPARASSADLLVILQDDATGQVEELIPNSIDAVAGLVEVDMPHLSTCWVVVELPPIDLVTYLPFNVGDEYILRGDVSNQILTLRVEQGPMNANFPSPDVLTLAFEFAGFRSGYYVEILGNDDLVLVGQFADDGFDSLEEVHDQATLLVPALIEDGDVFHSESSYTGHIPVGNPTVAYTGSFVADTEIFTADVIFVTPVGDFPEPVIFIREEDWMDSDGFFGFALTAFALAADLGVIALEIDDFETFLLIDGTVGGQPILLPEGR